MKEYAAGPKIPPYIKYEDSFYNSANARRVLASAF
jgi:hypothetical protein